MRVYKGMLRSGIRSNRGTNMSTCGGPSKSGLVPRHGQISSGVRVVGRGSMMLTCKSPSSNAYVGGGKKLG